MKLLGFYGEQAYILDVPNYVIEKCPRTAITTKDIEDTFARKSIKEENTYVNRNV